MTISMRMRSLASVAIITLAVAACGPKDADIKASVDTAVAATPGVMVDVTKGVATISGQFADDAAKTATEARVAAVKGVKSVVNNGTVAPPPPPPMTADETLKMGVDGALKDYPTLSAHVMDGVIMLSGEIKKSELPKVMQALSALSPKKIDNKAKVMP